MNELGRAGTCLMVGSYLIADKPLIRTWYAILARWQLAVGDLITVFVLGGYSCRKHNFPDPYGRKP